MSVRTARAVALALAALSQTACTAVDSGARVARAEAEIARVLTDQIAAWNDGDIDRFMETYWNSPELRFLSGGSLQEGWEATRARYRETYPDRSAMGQIRFETIALERLGPASALVVGRWHLARGTGELSGLFTLVLREIDGRWRIVHDHSSTARPDS